MRLMKKLKDYLNSIGFETAVNPITFNEAYLNLCCAPIKNGKVGLKEFFDPMETEKYGYWINNIDSFIAQYQNAELIDRYTGKLNSCNMQLEYNVVTIEDIESYNMTDILITKLPNYDVFFGCFKHDPANEHNVIDTFLKKRRFNLLNGSLNSFIIGKDKVYFNLTSNGTDDIMHLAINYQLTLMCDKSHSQQLPVFTLMKNNDQLNDRFMPVKTNRELTLIVEQKLQQFDNWLELNCKHDIYIKHHVYLSQPLTVNSELE